MDFVLTMLIREEGGIELFLNVRKMLKSMLQCLPQIKSFLFFGLSVKISLNIKVIVFSFILKLQIAPGIILYFNIRLRIKVIILSTLPCSHSRLLYATGKATSMQKCSLYFYFQTLNKYTLIQRSPLNCWGWEGLIVSGLITSASRGQGRQTQYVITN